MTKNDGKIQNFKKLVIKMLEDEIEEIFNERLNLSITEEGLKKIYLPSGKLLWEGGLTSGKREGYGTLYSCGQKLYEGILFNMHK